MITLKALIILFVLYFNTAFGFAFGIIDTINIDMNQYFYVEKKTNLVKPLIVPSLLMTFGTICMRNHRQDQINQRLKNIIQEDVKHKFPVDDYSQYLPTLAFLSLEPVFGIQANKTFHQRMYTGAVSHIIMATTVNIMKKNIKIYRPDQSAQNSFPSGHTATAFVGAELLWQEYHDESIWYGVSGYVIATGTGFFRMYNNKHWLSDIGMGAGIGILSTKIAYWSLPLFDRILANKKTKNYTITPTYDGQNTLLSLQIKF